MTKNAFTAALGLALVLISAFPIFSWEDPRFDQPLLITSAGQSAEVQLAAILAKRSELDYVLSKSASAGDMNDAKTLVLSLGASLKGLGAAGLDVRQEKDRVAGLVEAARSRDIPIVCLHLGGQDRRGNLSDEFISTFLPYARFAIVVRSGNQDGLFTRICGQHGIPLQEVEKTVDAMEPLKKAFR
jgi:hypothetical protein